MFDLSLWLLAGFVVFLVGLSKGGFGGGLGALAVPLLTLKIDPRLAAALLLPVLCIMDLVSVYAYRGRWNKRHVLALIIPALVGIGAGVVCFEYMSVRMIKFMIGSIAITFVFYYIWGRAWLELKKGQLQVFQSSGGAAANSNKWKIPFSAGFWGSISGFSSFVAHAGGPPATIYLLGQQLDKTAFVATTVLTFTIINLVKVIPYIATGLLHFDTIWLSISLLPIAPIGVIVGAYLHKKVSTKIFYGICYVLLFASGVKLIWDAI